MILINTTFHVHVTVAAAFKAWLRDEYVPRSVAHEHIQGARIARVLGGEDPDGMTFAVQLECRTLAEARHWHDNEGATLRGQMTARWGAKTLFFTTYLEVMDL